VENVRARAGEHRSGFGPLWTTITTYEGESLDRLAAAGRLDADTVERANAALQSVHGAGVLHGDVALCNAVRRERDGAVLWVDFQRAVLAQGEALQAGAASEMAELEVAVRSVRRKQPPSSPLDAPAARDLATKRVRSAVE